MTDTTVGFGLLLQRYRVAAGVSQEELAERAGLSRRGISDLERGARRTPHLGTVRRLAAALELDAAAQDALLAGAQRIRAPRAVTRAAPSAAAQPAHHASLPLPLNTLVGRDQAIAEIQNLLEKTHLLSLIGPGGIGKTRLSLEVARRAADHGGSVVLVELAPIRDPQLVPQAVATSLGIREHRERDVVDTLIDALARRPWLLVLDNCEQVLAACATLAERLLRTCSELRILTTSRERLDVQGEAPWRVPPLESVDPRHLPPIDELGRYAAVRLFLDRAAAVDRGFVLTESNAPAVAEICQKLDGMPLAIELAAARVNVLNADQLACRLDDRLRLLTSGNRSTPERQRTLRATLEWSYDLLENAERTLFARLAVFAGGWTLEACEVVCSGGSLARDDVLDVLGNLVDKSLVVASDTGVRRRYRMLETVREYALECLERTGASDELRSAHAAIYVALSEAAAPQLGLADELHWLQRLDAEFDNIRAAVQWLLERGDMYSALRMAPALTQFGWIRGRTREQRQWWDRCLAQIDVESPLHSMAALVAGSVAYNLGDYVRGLPLLDESLALARREGNKLLLAYALRQAGFAAPLRGTAAEPTMALFAESEALFSEFGLLALAANASIGLGQTARSVGDYDLARQHFQRSLALGRETGNPGTIAQALRCLASVEVVRGNMSDATAYLRESVPICAKLENGMFLGYCALHLAQIALAQGDGARAARLLGATDGLLKSEGSVIYPTYRTAWQQACDAAAVRVGEQSFAAIFADGQHLSLAEVAACALAIDEPPSLDTPSHVPPSDGLTPREREIARLVATGMSNREIAESLVISEGTTEVHLKHILSKLGVRSRTQVAARFAQAASVD